MRNSIEQQPRNRNPLTSIGRRAGLIALPVAMAISLVACSSEGEPVEDQGVEEPRTEVAVPGELFDITIFFEDGVMATVIDTGNHYSTGSIKSFCNGTDLVEYSNVDRGGGMSRSVNHPACDDGTLTPDDFPSPEQLANPTTTTTVGR